MDGQEYLVDKRGNYRSVSGIKVQTRRDNVPPELLTELRVGEAYCISQKMSAKSPNI